MIIIGIVEMIVYRFLQVNQIETCMWFENMECQRVHSIVLKLHQATARYRILRCEIFNSNKWNIMYTTYKKAYWKYKTDKIIISTFR